MKTESKLMQFSALAASFLDIPGADSVEWSLTRQVTAVTRFANSEIHQNVTMTMDRAQVRVLQAGRIGIASTTDLSNEALKAAADNALSLAQEAPPLEMTYRFPDEDLAYQDTTSFYDQATAESTPEQRAGIVAEVVRACGAAGAEAFGSLETGYEERVVMNSSGLHSKVRRSEASLVVAPMTESGSSSASRFEWSLSAINAGEVAREAAERCMKTEEPQPIAPGSYDVVILPYGIAEFGPFFGPLLFNADEYHRGESAFAGKLGQQVANPIITIREMGSDPVGLPLGIDEEGVRRSAIPLIENGVMKNILHDSITAGRYGTTSSGHAFPFHLAVSGPVARNLVWEPGTHSVAELIKQMGNGLFITRLNYVRCVDGNRAVVSGMTRDGTWLVENGEIKHPVRNMRFSIAIPDLLNQVEAMGSETLNQRQTVRGRRHLTEWDGCYRMPPLLIRGMQFTGGTRF